MGQLALFLLSHPDPAQLCSLVGHLPSLSSLESLRLRCKFLVSVGCISREPRAGPSCLIHFDPLPLVLTRRILTHDPFRPCRNTASYSAKGVSEEDGCFPCHTVGGSACPHQDWRSSQRMQGSRASCASGSQVICWPCDLGSLSNLSGL